MVAADLGGDLGGGLVVAVEHGDVGAEVGEAGGDGGSDAAGAAGDERAATVESRDRVGHAQHARSPSARRTMCDGATNSSRDMCVDALGRAAEPVDPQRELQVEAAAGVAPVAPEQLADPVEALGDGVGVDVQRARRCP